MPPEFDPYRVLGVPRAATVAEIGRAYRRLAKGAHPDLHGPDADARMRAINRAWEVLSDPARRSAWDRAHGGERPIGAHWPGAAQRERPPEAAWRPGPPSTWEVEPASGSPAGAREAVAGLPRPARSVRDSGWLAIAVGGVLVLAVVVLGAVAAATRQPASLEQAMRQAGVAGGTTVSLDGGNVLVVREVQPNILEAVHFFQGGEGSWREGQRQQAIALGENTVAVMTWDGVGRSAAWRSFVYGRSAPDVARVVLPDHGVGTEPYDGRWGIGLPDGALTVSALRWEFQAADGTVLLAGSGRFGD
ncbi:MAG TPA: J domain-containing protein [candidate division Zixibacteria bacterium]|nr:J domain-containing protein [candidate division Zixibacteria bacterium]